MTRTRAALMPSALSRLEQDIYARLLGTARTEAELARETRRTPASVAAALRTLEAAGIAVSLSGEPAMYAALPPGAVADRARVAQSESLVAGRALITRLAAAFDRAADRRDHELADVVVGDHESRAAFNEILAGARSEVRACESASAMRQGTQVGGAVQAQARRGVRFRVVYDRGGMDSATQLANLDIEMAAGEEARIGDVPFKLMLTDQPVGWLELRLAAYGNFARLRIRDTTLLAGLGAYFETVWEEAMPIPCVVAGDAPGAGDDGDRTLAWLMATGLSERAIAEYLGCHERTARRRVRAMMARLDAHTAFQAGYQLVRRGYHADLDAAADHA